VDPETDPGHWLNGNALAAKAMAVVELGIIAYVLLSPRVRQAFLDLPSG
jgi:hypothetical protein